MDTIEALHRPAMKSREMPADAAVLEELSVSYCSFVIARMLKSSNARSTVWTKEPLTALCGLFSTYQSHECPTHMWKLFHNKTSMTQTTRNEKEGQIR